MNADKLRDCFSRSLGIPRERVTDELAYNSIKEWDSVAHMVDTDDILAMSSVAKAREILGRLGVGFDAA
jgi:hypothetical protein